MLAGFWMWHISTVWLIQAIFCSIHVVVLEIAMSTLLKSHVLLLKLPFFADENPKVWLKSALLVKSQVLGALNHLKSPESPDVSSHSPDSSPPRWASWAWRWQDLNLWGMLLGAGRLPWALGNSAHFSMGFLTKNRIIPHGFSWIYGLSLLFKSFR